MTTQTSHSGHGVYLPALSKAIAPLLTPESLNTIPHWTYPVPYGDWEPENYQPYRIRRIIDIFDEIFLAIKGEGRGNSYLRSAPSLLREASGVWTNKKAFKRTVSRLTEYIDRLDQPFEFSREYPAWTEIQVWFVECALHPEAGLDARQQTFLLDMLKPQPDFLFSSELLEEHHSEEDILPGLRCAIQRLYWTHVDAGTSSWPDEEGVLCIVQEFIRLCYALGEIWEMLAEHEDDLSIHPRESDYYTIVSSSLVDLMREYFRTVIEDGTSPIPRRVKIALSTVNFDAACAHSQVLVFQRLEQPDWFDNTTGHIIRFAQSCLAAAPMQCEIDITAQKLGPINLTPPSWPILRRMIEQDAEEYRANIGNRIDRGLVPPARDVETVAVGPRINIWEYILPVTPETNDGTCAICLESFEGAAHHEVVVPLVCDHMYHYACLDELINSSGPTSGICCICRKVICEERRTIRPVEV